MTLHFASLDVWGLMDQRHAARVRSKLSNLEVNVAVMQETHFICMADCTMLEENYVVLAAFSNHHSAEASLLVGRSLEPYVNM